MKFVKFVKFILEETEEERASARKRIDALNKSNAIKCIKLFSYVFNHFDNELTPEVKTEIFARWPHYLYLGSYKKMVVDYFRNSPGWKKLTWIPELISMLDKVNYSQLEEAEKNSTLEDLKSTAKDPLQNIKGNIVVYYEVQNEHNANIYRTKVFTIKQEKFKSFIEFLKSLQKKKYYTNFKNEGQPKEDGFVVYSGVSDDGAIYRFNFVPEKTWQKVAADFFPEALSGTAGSVNVDYGDSEHQPAMLPLIDDETLENEVSATWNKHDW